MNLYESGEMYLETILVLLDKKKNVRSIDVAEHMNFSKPSVSRAMGKLKEDKLISIDKDGYITLTKKGQEVAGKVYDRHKLLTGLLKQVGVSDEVAEADACRMEHVVSDETIAALRKYLK